jgi:hypothetical protein
MDLRERLYLIRAKLKRRRGHKPGWSDIRPALQVVEKDLGAHLVNPRQSKLASDEELKAALPFWARPNFYYFEGCGRPCWLPVYPEPRIMKGCSLTLNWPYESWQPPDGSPIMGHFVEVLRQVRGERLRNEILQYSDIWNLIRIPQDRIDPRTRHLAKPAPDGDGYVGYAADLWLGNTGWHGRSSGPSWQRHR